MVTVVAAAPSGVMCISPMLSIAPLANPVQRQVPRALVVDDHPLMASAVSTAVSAMRIFNRVDVAGSFGNAIKLLESDAACGLAILDLHLGDSPARENLTCMRELFPDVPVLIFSGDTSVEHITMAFECNVRGYVTKSSPMGVLKSAIQLVLAGGSYVPAEAVSAVGSWGQPRATLEASEQLRLTGRQEQVFRLLLQGMPNKVIASRLQMAEGTVKAHLNTVFRVMNVRTRVEAILRARDLGLV
jgi:DNA-binding NarL/FixJ family response regulator